MDGRIRDIFERVKREIAEKYEKYGIIEDDVRAHFTREETEQIKKIYKQYTAQEVDLYLSERLPWVNEFNDEPHSVERWTEYYRELLKMPLKQ